VRGLVVPDRRGDVRWRPTRDVFEAVYAAAELRGLSMAKLLSLCVEYALPRLRPVTVASVFEPDEAREQDENRKQE